MAEYGELIELLHVKCGYEVVQQDFSDNRIYLLGRIRGQTLANNLVIRHRLLTAAALAPWKVDSSWADQLKQGRLVKGWRIIFQGEGIAQYLPDILRVIGSAPAAKVNEIMEVPLPGASADRNAQNGRGRGAGLTGKHPIGPMSMRGG